MSSSEYDFPSDHDLDPAFLDELSRIEQSHLATKAQDQPPPPPPALPASASQRSTGSSSSQGVRHLDVELEVELAIDRSLDATVEGGDWQEGDSAFLSSLGEDELEEAVERMLMARQGAEGDVEDMMPDHPSLFALFRRRNFFSVTDMAAPTWCEVQYDYGLRGKRFLKPSDRPTTFITSKGNVIEPNREIAIASDKTMRKGTQIHKALEREIHPEEIKVAVSTKEETWALRILNMMASLEAMLLLGKCREMPVMGFIKGHLVVGIIDEIQRVPLASASLSAPKSTSSSSPKKLSQSQPNKITSYFAPWPSPADKGQGSSQHPPTPTHTLRVSDSKTRKTRNLPREDASFAGKIQCQTYKYLLDALLRPSSDSSSPNHPWFSFPALFADLNLNSRLALSEDFLAQAQVLIAGNELDCPSIRTLDDLVEAWERTVARLGVDREEGCSKDLELVYRFQETSRGRKSGKRKAVGAGEDVGLSLLAPGKQVVLSVEHENERSLALAIQASLDGGEGVLYVEPGGDFGDAEGEEEEKALARALTESLLDVGATTTELAESPLEVVPEKDVVRLAATFEKNPPQKVTNNREDHHQNPRTLSPGTASLSQATSSTQRSDSSSFYVSQLHSSAPDLSQSIPSPSKPIEISDSDDSGSDSEDKKNVKPPQPVASPSFDEGSLSKLKHLELKTLAYKHSLPTWGRRIDLISRLLKSTSPTVTLPTSSKRARRFQSNFKFKSTTSSPNTSTSSYSDPSHLDASIIGTVKFQYEHSSILAHFDDILSFWLGERAPRGVSLEQTNRCNWCEFNEGCEWREQEGQRIWEEGRRKRAGEGS